MERRHMRQGKTRVICVALLLVLAMAGLLRWYTLHQSVQGIVLWNAKEAYLFIGIQRNGYTGSYLRFPLNMALAYLGASTPISDSHLALVVIRVNSLGLDRHVLELPDRGARGGYIPENFTPLNGNIYAFHPGVGFVRWAVDHFDPATPDEWEKLRILQETSQPDFENDANGWSRHTLFSGTPGVPFDVEVDNKYRIKVNNVKTTDDASRLLIDLLHPEGAVERLFDLESYHQRDVTASEYRHAFKREVRK